MREWNTVVTVHEHGFRRAMEALREFGPVARTEFFNVLVMQVDEPLRFLDELHACLDSLPGLRDSLARVMPVTARFRFQSPDEFEAHSREAVEPWLGRLADSRFHVRMHRRGFKGRLSSQHEEQFLDHHIAARLAAQGQGAQIDFDDPDYVIALETVGQEAGLSLWSREQRRRYPLLKLD